MIVVFLKTVLLAWAVGTVLPVVSHAAPKMQQQALPPTGMTEVVLDTVMAAFLIPSETPVPEFINVLPDTVIFGGLANLILDFPAGVEPVSLPGYTFNEDWVVLAEESVSGAVVDTSPLPAPRGTRVILPLRIYQLSPFQISSPSGVSRVIQVRGQIQNLDDVAPIRSPHLWGLDPTQLFVGGLLLLVLLLLVFWYWRRRITMPPVMEGYEQKMVVWPLSAMDLLALHDGGLLDKGESREFLSVLVRIARDFVAGRFYVGAREMTGKEIEEGCLAQGYELTAVRPFTLLIGRVDQMRYNPELPQPALCRGEFNSLVEMIKNSRITSVHSPVSAADLLAGQKAWAQLDLLPGRSKGEPS